MRLPVDVLWPIEYSCLIPIRIDSLTADNQAMYIEDTKVSSSMDGRAKVLRRTQQQRRVKDKAAILVSCSTETHVCPHVRLLFCLWFMDEDYCGAELVGLSWGSVRCGMPCDYCHGSGM